LFNKLKFALFFLVLNIYLFSKPFWIDNPPVEKNYIYFVGKTEADKYSKRAKRKALSKAFKEAENYFKNKLKKSKFEMIKKYFDFKNKKVYVLARYPVYEFYKERQEKILKEKQREKFIRKNLKKALSNKEDGKVIKALKILNKLRMYKIKDEDITSDIKSMENEIIEGIKFKIYPYSDFATTSKEYPSKIKIKLFFQEDSIPITETKIAISFEKGSGWIEKNTLTTDKKGEVEFGIKRFNSPGENIIAVKLLEVPEYLSTPETYIKFQVTGGRIVLKSKSYLIKKGERKEDYFLFLEEGSPIGTLKLDINSKQYLLLSFELLNEEAVYEVTERVDVAGIKITGKKNKELKIEPAENLSGKTWNIDLPPISVEVILDRYRIVKIQHPYKGEIKIFGESQIILNIYYY